MKINYCSDYDQMSKLAASLIIDEIDKKKDLLLCAATGHSPMGLYDALKDKAVKDKSIFNQLKIIKLDEWSGIPDTNPATCEYYLRLRLLEPLGIPNERYIAFSSTPENPDEECKRVQSLLSVQGPINLCILGLGKNGHLGLNEPETNLKPHCHLGKLSSQTLQHHMLKSGNTMPFYGMTLGMKDILSSGKIVLLISGDGKKIAVEKLLEETITTDLPASFLRLHQDVEVFIDKTALSV